jgi:hypothetical protein
MFEEPDYTRLVTKVLRCGRGPPAQTRMISYPQVIKARFNMLHVAAIHCFSSVFHDTNFLPTALALSSGLFLFVLFLSRLSLFVPSGKCCW